MRRAGLARAQGRLQVLRALLRLRARRPGVLHRGHAAPARRRARGSSGHRRGRERRRRLRGAQPATSRSASCASPTALGPDLDDLALAAAAAAGGPVHPRLRPALPVRPRGRHRRRARARRRATTSPASTTSRRTACSRCRRSSSLLGKPLAPILPPWGTGLAARRRCASPASGSRPRCSRQLRYGRGLDNRKLKATGYGCATRPARPCQRFAEELRLAAELRRRRRGALPLRARGRGLPALQPERARPADRRRAARTRQRPVPTAQTSDVPEFLQLFRCGRNPCVLLDAHRSNARPLTLPLLAGLLIVALLAGAAAVYAYDDGQDDQIAEGVTVGGVDVGGMSGREARSALRARAARAARPARCVARYHGKRFTLTPRAGGDRRRHRRLGRRAR